MAYGLMLLSRQLQEGNQSQWRRRYLSRAVMMRGEGPLQGLCSAVYSHCALQKSMNMMQSICLHIG